MDVSYETKILSMTTEVNMEASETIGVESERM